MEFMSQNIVTEPSATAHAVLPPEQREQFSAWGGDFDWPLIARHLRLSDRETQIVQAICAEQKDSAIAGDLGISPHTVRTHLERLYRKLGVHGRVGVAVAACRAVLRQKENRPVHIQ